MASRQQQFVESAYWDARAAGLNDTQARLAAAQASLETGYGRSVAGQNYFGIKAGSSWNGPTVNVGTWEEENGVARRQRDDFRAYSSPVESFLDYAGLLANRFPDAFYAEDFDQAAAGLKAGQRGGYATDSRYGQKLDFINSTYDPNPLGVASRFDIPTPTARPDYVAPAMAAVDPFEMDVQTPNVPSMDLLAFDPQKNPELNYAPQAPSMPEMAYSEPEKLSTPFDAVMSVPSAPSMPASVAGYTDTRVSAPNAGKAPSAPIDKVTEAATKPDIPDLASQYASYGAGRQLKEQAANLALDVAQTKGIAPNFMPTAPAIATQPTAPKAPSITDVQPKAPDLPAARNVSNAPQVKTVDSQYSKAAETNKSNAMRDSVTLAGLQKQDQIVNGIVGALGSVVGGMFLGPIGGILGAQFAPKLLAPITNQAPKFYPTAPVNPNYSGGGSGYESLSDYGRETYNSSGQFRDAVDAVDSGKSQGGLW